MKTLSEVVASIGRIERAEIETWIERSWVIPLEHEPEPTFSELDIARISLICDLRRDVGVEDETMPLVLSLIDQLYATRRRMCALTEAIQRQPEDVRRAIYQTLAGRRPPE